MTATVSSVEASSQIEIRSTGIVCAAIESSCSRTNAAPLYVHRTTSALVFRFRDTYSPVIGTRARQLEVQGEGVARCTSARWTIALAARRATSRIACSADLGLPASTQ